MTLKKTPQIDPIPSVQKQISRRVFPLVTITCAIIGLVSLLGIRANARQALQGNHDIVLTDVVDHINSYMNRHAQTLRQIAADPQLQVAGQLFAENATSEFLVERNTLLGKMLGILEQQPDSLVALRLVGTSGRQIMGVVNSSEGTASIAELPSSFSIADDAFRAALEAQDGQVVFFQQPEFDAGVASQDVMRFALALHSPGENGITTGVLQLDVSLSSFYRLFVSAAREHTAEVGGRRFLLLDHDNRTLFDSGESINTPLDTDANGGQGQRLNRPGLGIETYLTSSEGDLSAVEINNRLVSARDAQLYSGQSRPWRVVLVDDPALVLGSSYTLSTIIFVGSIVFGFAAALLLTAYLRRTLSPVEHAAGLIQELARGGSVEQPVTTQSNDVLQSVHHLSTRLQDLNATIENQRAQFRSNLETAARISRETATLSDLEELLNRVINQICDEYGFYHAQVFTVDEIGVNAILAYSRGEAGAALLARNHRLAVGSKSVIGTVTATGQPAIVNDTARAKDRHTANDLLPNTRAEMALPLLIGEAVIGALDIQSTQPDVFHQDDVQVFQLLADQIAIAIYNRRLLQQSDERVQQINDLNRQLTRSAWEGIDEKINLERTYTYDLTAVRSGAPETDDTVEAISLPIRVRGEVIGSMDVAFSDSGPLSEDERTVLEAVTDRLALAIENARLFQETELSLSETSSLYDVNRLINEAASLDAMVEAIVTSVAPDAFAAQILEFDDAPGDTRDRLSVAAEWRGRGAASLLSLSVRIADHPFISALPLDRATLIDDLKRDPRIDDAFRRLLAPLNPRALVIIPLNVRGSISGGILIEYAAPRRFRERDERIFTSLIDQAGVAIDNRMLLRQTEEERRKLSSVLEALPAGVLVLDAETFLPIQTNLQIDKLFKRPLDLQTPFSVESYPMYRTGTEMAYTDEELPIYIAALERRSAFSDDIVMIHPDGSKTDLLMSAAPINDNSGKISAIVAVIENIGNLRGLENALQDNLRETISLYEVTRSLAEADETEEVLDTLITQLAMNASSDAAVIMIDERDEALNVARTLIMPPELFIVPRSALHDRQSNFISDVSQDVSLDDEARAVLEALGSAAFVSIPLRTQMRELPSGWIVSIFSEAHSFTPEDERFLTTLAESAAVALDNRALFLSTQSALQEASILFQASRALTNATSHQDILDAVIDYLLQPYTTHAFIAQLEAPTWDSPNASASVVAGWRTDDSSVDLTGVSLTPEEFLAWRQLASPQLTIIGDTQKMPDLNELERAGFESLGVRSVVVMPLRVLNRQIGAIWMGMSEPFAATERDVRIYQSFAEQTSISLEASRLLTQTERRARQLEISAQVSQSASSLLDLDALLPRLVDLIRDAFNYDHVQVFLMDREGEYAVLRASTGEAGRQLLGIGHRLQRGSRSVIGTVTAEMRPAIALDTGSADVVHRPNPYLPHTRSEVALPLVVKNKIVGALDVQSNQPNAFGDDDLIVLTTLAAQISVAIDNARLFEQAEHRANDMSLLFAVTTAAASAESLASSLQNVAEDLRDSLSALTVGIYLPVAYGDALREETYTMMQIAAVAGINQPVSELTEVKVGDPKNLIGTSASSFRSFIINKVAEESLYLPLDATAASAAVVPLTSAARLIGLIVLESAETFAFDHETLTLLQTMGGTLSAIIQNAQLLEQVQHSNEQLRELDRIKSEFLANMSHELRTPLNSIIGFSRVILKGIDGPLTEMQEQDLGTIYNSGQHLLGLINDILDQAKIASGKMDLKFDYFDVRPVVEGVRSIGIGLVKDKPITISIDIQSGLPQVYGDEFRTRQVLLNLISNAAKFTNEGSIVLGVYSVHYPDLGQSMVRIDVSDTGIGIAQKDMPLLFEPFRQIDSSLTRTAGGTGLGLPISKSLVEMQGGQMAVESTINVGSTFSLTIPTEPSSSSQMQSEAQQHRPGGDDITPTPSSNGEQAVYDTSRIDTSSAMPQERLTTQTVPMLHAKRQVLLIEDNPDRVDQFRRAIQREGFDVFTASIPLEAEAMASGLRPMIIIMDVSFSGGQGWDILSKLKRRDDTFDIPVIVVTLSQEKERALEMGAFSFLQHPITPEELVDAVRQAEQDSSTERILIIDDQPESARLLKQLLDEHGQYRVFAAHNGMEGVSLVARRRPDLVILDLRMPDMDGFAVLQELRSNPETVNIPILVVTGDTLDSEERARLADINVVYKTEISLMDYQRFIQGVESHLSRSEG